MSVLSISTRERKKRGKERVKNTRGKGKPWPESHFHHNKKRREGHGSAAHPFFGKKRGRAKSRKKNEFPAERPREKRRRDACSGKRGRKKRIRHALAKGGNSVVLADGKREEGQKKKREARHEIRNSLPLSGRKKVKGSRSIISSHSPPEKRRKA